jgi:two-component system cell cycle response regulator
MKILQAKISNFVKIHTMPQVLSVLLGELESDKSSASSIAEVLSKDISLTARILRVANSSFYGRQSEIATIDKAVTLLGMKAVKALALSVSMFDLAGGITHHDIIDFKSFWRHNLEMAVISRQLAGLIKGFQPEEAFVCGLMHDLGILFFIQEYPDEYIQVLKLADSGHNLEDAERRVMHCSHSEVGALIAKAWNLPEIIRRSIAEHHNPAARPDNQSNFELWQIINLGHRYCRQGLDLERKQASADLIEQRYQLANDLGINSQSAGEVLSDSLNQVIQAAAFLDVDIGEPLHLLQNVNLELGQIYEEYETAIIENKNLQAKILEHERRRVALEALRTTLATFSHYVNNATAAIIGRAQILDLYLTQGKLEDHEGKISHSVKIISESVDTICAVLDELKEFPEFKTVTYHGTSRILDIDKNIKARLGRLA